MFYIDLLGPGMCMNAHKAEMNHRSNTQNFYLKHGRNLKSNQKCQLGPIDYKMVTKILQ